MSPNGGTPGTRAIIFDGLWHNNPVFRQILGICSTLAVTNLVLNTLVMCAALTMVLAASSLTVSLLRKFTPRNIRMMVQTLVIAFYVIIVDTSLRGYWPDMSAALGPYVGLIITNCIIMGRCEAFAGTNKPFGALTDGFFNGLGYSLLLLAIAIPRELLGMGSILGFPMPYFSGAWDRWIIMVMPPGAFFTLAVIVWICRAIKPREEKIA